MPPLPNWILRARVWNLCCHGRPITDKKLASFGNPHGECGAFSKGSCETKNDALSIVQNPSTMSCAQDMVQTLALEAVC
ncbi:unnamed protein product [Sphenostylis stenocarpa]|uniref:Uncharacterized protein n=1 Tax=Sphenostylis stenocarpa TaxID=92480 RepID=A0AA86SZ64_9FABA|nr:unnamed protein product [Sphenostylis stenocarpa]